MGISLPGLGSGLDTEALISALVNAERVPISLLQSRQRSVDSASTTLSTFSSKLTAFRAAAQALSTPEGYASFTTTSSSPAVVATATGAAAAGAYDVTVSALAREQRTYSDVYGSSSTGLGLVGTLQLAVGAGAPKTVNIAAGDSLTTIAANISASGARVQASVVYTGAGYKLQVRGMDSGAANALTFTETGLTLGLNVPANTFQTARDAAFRVDGIDITRPTNQVTGVIPGVTLALTAESATAVKVQVNADSAGFKTKVKAFVAAYNDVVNAGHNAAGFGSTKASNTVLAGDRTIRSSLDRFARIVSSQVAGTSGRYTSLGAAGLKPQSDGTLALDEAKFDAAVQADAAGVARLFVTDASSGSQGAMASFAAAVDTLTVASDSAIKSRQKSLADLSKRMALDLEKMESRIDRVEKQLRTTFASLDAQMGRYQSLASAVTGAMRGSNTNGSL